VRKRLKGKVALGYNWCLKYSNSSFTLPRTVYSGHGKYGGCCCL